MRVVSLNVGQPRIIETPRGGVLTSIFKEPVDGRRKIVPHHVEGDRQADLRVHGGPGKAVYAYSAEHYDYWAKELVGDEMQFGKFGENLTVEGLAEADTCIGDLFEVGTAVLRVTQPRMPCVKLAIRFERSDMVKRFWKSGRSGIYFAVEREGEVAAGDEVRRMEAHPLRVSVSDVVRLYKGETSDSRLYERFIDAPVSGSWKEEIREKWMNL